MMKRFAAAIFLGLLSLTGAAAEPAFFDVKYWGRASLPTSESTEESILARAPRWEEVRTYNSSSRLFRLGNPVGRVEFQVYGDTSKRMGICTGFIVAPSLIMTNHHCIGKRRIAAAQIRFGYFAQYDDGEVFQLETEPVLADEALDFALVRVIGSPEDRWGTVRLSNRLPARGDQLAIYHHPDGAPKMISRVGCFKGPPYSVKADFLHQCDTIGGSSGSPVFDENDDVVGLHKAGTKDKYNNPYNYATLMAAIAPRVQGFGITILRVGPGGNGGADRPPTTAVPKADPAPAPKPPVADVPKPDPAPKPAVAGHPLCVSRSITDGGWYSRVVRRDGNRFIRTAWYCRNRELYVSVQFAADSSREVWLFGDDPSEKLARNYKLPANAVAELD